MITEIPLPPELTLAARSLEERLRILRAPTRKVPISEWSVVPEKFHELIPAWLPSLLANHSLMGMVLECANNVEDATWPRYFCFNDPESFKTVFEANDYVWNEEIIKKGMVPISYEQNGDLWVTSSKDGPESPIFLFDLSGMKNVFASSRIALLLASMAVNGNSFDPEEPRSVMWHRDS